MYYNPFHVCRIYSDMLAFITNSCYLCSFSLFLISLTWISSILLILSKNQILVLLIFSLVSFQFPCFQPLSLLFPFLHLIWVYFTLLFLINLFIFGCVGSSLLHGLSLVAVSGGYSLLRCAGFSLQWLLLLRSMGCRVCGLQ